MLFHGIDTLYIYLVLPAVLLAFWAQMTVSSTFTKYSKVPTRYGMTGYDSARMILDKNWLYDVKVEKIAGNLTDHFDPRFEYSEVVGKCIRQQFGGGSRRCGA